MLGLLVSSPANSSGIFPRSTRFFENARVGHRSPTMACKQGRIRRKVAPSRSGFKGAAKSARTRLRPNKLPAVWVTFELKLSYYTKALRKSCYLYYKPNMATSVKFLASNLYVALLTDRSFPCLFGTS